MISIIIPSYNNLKHLKNACASVAKHAPQAELILLDDGSTDGTWEWIWKLAEAHQHREVKCYRSTERVGHTILYDKGIELATNEIVSIMHADMIMGPNYVDNLVKHLKPGIVVCGTRVEPPLHPEGKEKIIMNFGLDFDDLDIPAFEAYVLDKQVEFKDQTTKGMFAPWVICKKDFVSMGGHDALFAPFPYEDSDIFQRWIIAGYKLVQSRDAFVYHLTCRGHRWTEKIQKDDDFYKQASNNASRNYLRKWGTWIKNDEYQHPIINNKYDVGFVIRNCQPQMLHQIEPWGSCTYIEDQKLIDSYLAEFQKETKLDLSTRVKHISTEKPHAIIIEFDGREFSQEAWLAINQLSDVLDQIDEVGSYGYACFRIEANKVGPEKIELPFVMVNNVF